jgi:hypothetical protein
MLNFFKETKKPTSRHSNNENKAGHSLTTLNKEESERINQQFAQKTERNYKYVDTVVLCDGTRLHRLVAPYSSIREAEIMCDDGRILSNEEREKFICG